MDSLKKTTLGARTFFASCHAKDTCGNNGLPLTPNSIRILGLFQLLKKLSHKNLCTYLDVLRSKHDGDILLALSELDKCQKEVEELDAAVKSFIQLCLTVLPKNRPTAKQLLLHPLVAGAGTSSGDAIPATGTQVSPLRCEPLTLTDAGPCLGEPLEERPLQELYFLWRLAGGDAEAELRRRGCLRAKPPICTLPCIVLLEGDELVQRKDSVFFFDDTIVTLPTEQLCQLQRIILYKRLLEAYPFQRQRIVREAKLDIPPLYRAHIWAALLDVQGDLLREYEAIDKETPTPTDRQA
ncbi:hypothetical protein HPB47_003761, partial [Ixodes persulcatus]